MYGGIFWLVGWCISFVCFIVILKLVLTKNSHSGFTIIWLILTALHYIPGVYTGFVGSMIALYIAGPEQIVIESRELINCSNSRNYIYDEKYPPAIERLHPQDILISHSSHLEIRKFGLGDFAGFIVFCDDDVKVNESSGIKIIDGLYWFANG